MQEMAEAEEAAKKKRRVPKGTSAYQAAWILDDYCDDEEADEADELVEYNSDPDAAQAPAPGTIAGSEFGRMTEFPDEDNDAMEVCWLVLYSSLVLCTFTRTCVSDGLPIFLALDSYGVCRICLFASPLLTLLHFSVKTPQL